MNAPTFPSRPQRLVSPVSVVRSLLALAAMLCGVPAGAQVILDGDPFPLRLADIRIASLEVAADPYGHAVAVWEEPGAGTFAQRFDQEGQVIGDLLTVDSDSQDPAVAMALDGRFLIVFTDLGDGHVYGRWYDGAAGGDRFSINPHSSGISESPSVALGPDGSGLVVWDSGSEDIWAQRLDSTGAPEGEPFEVPTDSGGLQELPEVAANLNGDFLVLWSGEGPDDEEGSLFGRVFDPWGNPVDDPFTLESQTEGNYSFDYRVAGGLDNEFLVSWWLDDGQEAPVVFQRLDRDGTVLVDTTQVNTTTEGTSRYPTVATSDLDGYSVIFWENDDGSGAPEIFGQWLDPDGILRGEEFVANIQGSIDEQGPAAMIGANGRFLALSQGEGLGGETGLWAQRFLPPVTVEVNDVSIIEGTEASEGAGEGGGATEASALFTVSLSRQHDLGETITVDFVTEDDTATFLSDYERTSATLTFEPGEALAQSLSVPIVGDAVYEEDETFFLNLVSATEAVILGEQGEGTIVDDDPVPTLSIDDVTLDEGAQGETTPFVFTVSLSGTLAQDVTVEFETLDGSGESGAEGGIDYERTSGELILPAGTTAAQLAVEVYGDGEAEDDETFVVNLFDSTPVAIAVEQGTGTLVNDDCAISLDSYFQQIPATGGFFLFELFDPDGCGWTAVPSDDWILDLTPTSGSGDATLSFRVDATADAGQRAAEILIEERVFEILQDGNQETCTYSVTGGDAFGPEGGSGSVSVVPDHEDCIWIAASEEYWISLDGADADGVIEATGAGDFTYTVATHLETTARSGMIEVNGQPVAINQDGCSYALDPAGRSDVSYSGAAGSTAVVTESVCPWTALSDDAWITVTSGASGTGPGTVAYSVTHNLITVPRTGTLTVEDQVFTIDQESFPCDYALSEAAADFGPDGGAGSFEVTALGGCGWTAESDAPWLTVTVGASGDGVGLVEYEAHANLSTADRSATVTVEDQIYEVAQRGFLFYDPFDDGVLATDWTYAATGSWSESGGELLADAAGTKAEAFADPAFAGCTTCEIETTLRQTTVGGTKPKVMLHAWYQNSDHRVVVVMNEARNTWKLMQKWDGVKAKVKTNAFSILPNRDYAVRVVFDGTVFTLDVDGTRLLTLEPLAGSAPSGTVGYKVKQTRAAIGEIEVAQE
ncbi:MAG: Calx-beta domain-containing protein [Acidobacteriota bacterium]